MTVYPHFSGGPMMHFTGAQNMNGNPYPTPITVQATQSSTNSHQPTQAPPPPPAAIPQPPSRRLSTNAAQGLPPRPAFEIPPPPTPPTGFVAMENLAQNDSPNNGEDNDVSQNNDANGNAEIDTGEVENDDESDRPYSVESSQGLFSRNGNENTKFRSSTEVSELSTYASPKNDDENGHFYMTDSTENSPEKNGDVVNESDRETPK